MSLTLLSGCAGTAVQVADPLCNAIEPVCISKDDRLTRKTAERLVKNEYGRAAVCGVPKPCPKEVEDKKAVASKQ